MDKFFNNAASWTAKIIGKPYAFFAAVIVVLIWASSGPILKFNETWQLIINTGTTILTFLMIFLLQNSQNRDGIAIQAKLDELISATKDARDDIEHIEDLSEKEIEKIRK